MWSIKPEDKDLIEKAKRFMEKYYRTFDANRADLVNLFREESVLAFEGQQIKGKEAILAKLTSIPECHNEIADFNCLRHRTPGSMLVWVCGQTWVGGTKDKADAVLTNQMFHLMPTPEGGFYVGTQIWSPFDLNKIRASLAAPPMSASAPAPASVLAALPMSTSASSESASASSESTLALPISMMKISTLALASVSALPMATLTSSESTLALPISASASSESALLLPISMMKFSTLGPPMSTMKHP
ncbi:hypothetical protein ACJRO7_032981 [Eucalyptus globulus]|uniref:NTF2 domain-containing protein n=1 Tax=Eucalyptus globulus TaxID=34317 RepID=A0ABD3JL59_EUCGL